MKKDVEEASCIQAVWRLKYVASLHADRIAQGLESYSEKVGPISESGKYGGRSGIDNLSPGALKLLQPWMTGKRVLRG